MAQATNGWHNSASQVAHNVAEDNDWLHLFEMISKGVNPISEHSITVERGMYLKENIIRGDKKWEAFSKAVSPLIHVPTLYAFKQYKEKNNPKLGK